MRSLVAFILALMVLLSMSKCGVVRNGSPHGQDCYRVREGEFTDVANGSTIFLTRTPTEQYETSARNGVTPLTVHWLNDCTYQLARQDRGAGADLEPDTITIRISGVSDTGFTYIATAVVFDTLRTLPGYQLFGLVKH